MFASNAARVARTGSPPSANSSLQAFASSLVGSTSASTPTNVASNLVLNGQNLGPYGWVSKTTSVTISSFTETDWFTSTADQPAFVIINGSLTINSGITFTPAARKKFLCIFVNGGLSLSGSISMTRKGAADTSLAFIQVTLDRRVDQTGASGGASRSTNGAGYGGSSSSGTYYGTGGGGGGGASGGGCALLFGPSNAAATLSATGGAATVSGAFPQGPAGGNGGNGSTAFVVI